MKHQILLISFLITAFLIPAHTQGQSRQYRDRMDQIKYRSQTNPGQMLQRDRREVENFHRTVEAYKQALRYRNSRRARILSQELVADMRREVRQSERKLVQGNNRYYSDTRATRRPDGVSPNRGRGQTTRRRNILHTQEDIMYDFLHIQEPRRSGNRGGRDRARIQLELLNEFLTSMDSELRLSRKELSSFVNSSNRRRGNTRYRRR